MSCEVFLVVVQFHPSPPHKTYLLLTHKSSTIALFKDPGLLNVVQFTFPFQSWSFCIYAFLPMNTGLPLSDTWNLCLLWETL